MTMRVFRCYRLSLALQRCRYILLTSTRCSSKSLLPYTLFYRTHSQRIQGFGVINGRKTLPNSWTPYSSTNKTLRWHEYSSEYIVRFIELSKREGFNSDIEFAKLEENLQKYTGRIKGSINFQILNVLAIEGAVKLIPDYINYCKNTSTVITNLMLLRAVEGVTPHNPSLGLQWIYEYINRCNPESLSRDLKLLASNLFFTKDWLYGVELMENFHLLEAEKYEHRGTMTHLVVRSLLTAKANKDLNTYYRLLARYGIYLRSFSLEAFQLILQSLELGHVTPDVFLEVMTYAHYGLSAIQVEDIKKFFQNYWGDTVKMEYVLIEKDICPSCGVKLQKPHVSKKDLEQFKFGLLEKFQVNNSEALLNYVNLHGPFDAVVDLLNFTRGGMLRGKKLYDELIHAQKLLTATLGRDGIRLLFIGAGSQKKTFKPPKGCHVFEHFGGKKGKWIKGVDDLLVMIAALHSGPDTYYVTSDYFRDHANALTMKDFDTFEEWRSCRQIKTRSQRDGVYHLEMPVPFACVTQETEVGWHIPFAYTSGIHNDLKIQRYELSNKFLCIQKGAGWKPSETYSEISDDVDRFTQC